jgi:thioredoxin-related protein
MIDQNLNKGNFMKKLILCAVAGWLAFQANAAEWLTDLPKALAQAKAEHKQVLMDFTGSDWCPPCKALHKNVLTSEEFETYAKANLILVVVDFPHHGSMTDDQKETNKALAEKYNVDGFPTIIVLDGEGKQLSKDVGYSGEETKDFIAKLPKAKTSS